MYKVAVIGDRSTAQSFMAVGLKVFMCSDPAAARSTLHKLVKDGTYAIIYITENFCPALEKDFDRYKDLSLPAIIPIPGVSGRMGYGTAKAKKAVERAVGVDVVYNEEK